MHLVYHFILVPSLGISKSLVTGELSTHQLVIQPPSFSLFPSSMSWIMPAEHQPHSNDH